MDEPRVALVHDWLTGMRGGEKVLLELCRLFPRAPVYTLLHVPGSVAPEIDSRVRAVSWLQRLPGAAAHYRNYLPLFPAAIRSLRLESCELVLSTSHAVAKAARPPAGAVHVSYIHTPMRYLWDADAQYFAFGRFRRGKRAGLMLAAPFLRRFDVRSNRGVNHFVANSRTVQQRVRSFWGVSATVIYPPVDTEFFTPAGSDSSRGSYLIVSSLEPYKRIELAIGAFRKLGLPLRIAGDGTLRRDLQSIAPRNVEFLGHVSGKELRELYRGCRALVFPGIEDFGMVAVEAQACGKPVIACGQGGLTESVEDGATGVHFWPQTADALVAAVRRAEALEFDPRLLRRSAERFSRKQFRDKMVAFLRAHADLPLPRAPHR